jgi:hypothetical protein
MWKTLVINNLYQQIPKPLAHIVLGFCVSVDELKNIELMERGFILLLLARKLWSASGIGVRGASVQKFFAESLHSSPPGLTPRLTEISQIVHMVSRRAITARIILSNDSYFHIINAILTSVPGEHHLYLASYTLYEVFTSFNTNQRLKRLVDQNPPTNYPLSNKYTRYSRH